MRGDHKWHANPAGAGEQNRANVEAAETMGPPPRVRGAAEATPPVGHGCGTNPAGAGSRVRGRTVPGRRWDQPRGCGEQTAGPPAPDEAQGPTPHARGPRGGGSTMQAPRGTNPACAGTTPEPQGSYQGSGGQPRMRGTTNCATSSSTRGRDQPRMRGDHRSIMWAHRLVWGPTPHARGPQCGRRRPGVDSVASFASSRLWHTFREGDHAPVRR